MYYLLQKLIKSLIVTTILIVVLWGILYDLITEEMFAEYIGIGALVCLLNTWIMNYRQRKVVTIIQVQGSWLVAAGFVLVLYHSGFVQAAVFAAAVLFASPFLGATYKEGIVGLSLLIVLAEHTMK